MNYMLVDQVTFKVMDVIVAEAQEDVYVPDGQTALPVIADAAVGATLNASMDTVIAPPVVEVPVPGSVTRYQARVALRRVGLRDTVEAMVTQAGGDVKDAWDDAAVFERYSPFIVTMGTALGLTEKQIDDLFIMASTIT